MILLIGPTILGAAAAAALVSIATLSSRRRAHRQAAATRSVIGQETAILQSLDPTSEAAARLREVVDARTRAYVGIDFARPRILGASIEATVWGLAAGGATSLLVQSPPAHAASWLGFALGLSSTMAAFVCTSVVRALASYKRRAAAHAATPAGAAS